MVEWEKPWQKRVWRLAMACVGVLITTWSLSAESHKICYSDTLGGGVRRAVWAENRREEFRAPCRFLCTFAIVHYNDVRIPYSKAVKFPSEESALL